MADLVDQIRDFYRGLEPAGRRAVVAAGAASLLAIGAVGVWASRTEFILFTHATTADEAAEITRSLGQEGVPFRVDADGLTIRVPADAEVDARKAAASRGLYVGLEGLPSIPAFVTPGQEQLYAKRMIQGELVRMINALSGVAGSDVQISLPERTAYLRQQQRASASVTLHPEQGLTIDPGAARSVAQLVSHAVADMTPQDVTVVDASTMRVLWGDGATPGGSEQAGGDLSALASAREVSLASAVRESLGQVLGNPNSSSVTVRVELESSATQTTTKSVDPDRVVTSTEKLETEKDSRTTTVAAGVPGTDSNLPERTGGAGAAGTGRERETQSTSYDFGSSVSTVTRPAGDIRRISATVIVDAAAFATVADGRDAAEVRKRFEAAVRGALGASESRGDTVVFDVLPFAPVVAPPELVATAPAGPTVASLLPSLIALLAVILGFVFFVRPLMRAIRPAQAEGTLTLAGGVGVAGDGPDGAPAIDLADRIRARVAALQSHAPSEVSELVEKESEHSAEVIRRWIRA